MADVLDRHAHRQAMDDWANRARAASVWDTLNLVASGHRVKLRGRKAVGPCPDCGGHDRFSVDLAKNLFFCRKSGTGGDAIDLVRYVLRVDFLGAVEFITGEAPPNWTQGGPRGQVPDPAVLAERAKARARAEVEAARADVDYRQREIDRARTIWREGEDFSGSTAEAYLRLRGCQAPEGARLRSHPSLKYWHYHSAAKQWRVVHEGPAMLARIDDADNRFMGCHCTWLDLNTAKGKAEIVDPETGEILDAKKVRGTQKGGHIHLGGNPAQSVGLYVGEGIETVLSVREALREDSRTFDGVVFWSSINLGNLGGPQIGSVAHPTLTRTDSRGRVRSVKVPSGVPDMDPAKPALWPPQGTVEAVLLGDGDSDRFSTELVLRRAATRWHARGVVSRAAWPVDGTDFNQMRMDALAARAVMVPA